METPTRLHTCSAAGSAQLQLQLRTRSAELRSRDVSVKLIRSPQLAPTAPYAYAAVAHGLVFTAGACPLDADGVVVSPGDLVAQTHQVMRNLVTALRAAGADLHDVAKSTVYVASSTRADLVTVWEIVHSYFGDHDVPSTLLGVAVLGYENQLVEVEAIALLPEESPLP